MWWLQAPQLGATKGHSLTFGLAAIHMANRDIMNEAISSWKGKSMKWQFLFTCQTCQKMGCISSNSQRVGWNTTNYFSHHKNKTQYWGKYQLLSGPEYSFWIRDILINSIISLFINSFFYILMTMYWVIAAIFPPAVNPTYGKYQN